MKRQQALAYFVEQGWTLAQAAGIVANLEAESGLREGVVGDGGQAYGIAQWHPPRQANFAAKFGKDIQGSSFTEQLAFVHSELQSTERVAGSLLRGTVDAGSAGAVVSKHYERPADREGEATKRAALAERIFAEATQSQPAAPIEDRSTEYQPETGGGVSADTGATMPFPFLAVLGAFAPILSELIPQIATFLKPGSEVAKRNVGIAQVLVETITKNAGSESLEGAIKKMQADPVVLKKVQEAVVTHPEIIGVLEIGGGIPAAREYNLAVQKADKSFLHNPSIWVTVALLPLIYYVTLAIMAGGAPNAPWWAGIAFTPETRAGAAMFILGTIIGGIAGMYYGTSYGSQRKTEIAAIENDKVQ